MTSQLRVACFAVKHEENICDKDDSSGHTNSEPNNEEEHISYQPDSSEVNLLEEESPKEDNKDIMFLEEEIPQKDKDIMFLEEESSEKDIMFREEESSEKDNKDIFKMFHDSVGKVDNKMSVRFSTSDANGNSEKDLMSKLGLPTKFAHDFEDYIEDGNISEQGSKGEKSTYYCKVCMIQLNSYDTMKSHVKGIKHIKKNSEKTKESAKKGQPVIKTAPKVIQIPNPEPKKKVPIRLHEKMTATLNPIVGLKFVKEYRPVSDIEMEPHYECKLCDKQGQANGMFSHIMGLEHRRNFIQDKFHGDQAYMDLNQKELLILAEKYRENDVDVNFFDLITTHNSDESYPWPAGKAPWAIERGGTGIAPDNARENYGKNMMGKCDVYAGKSLVKKETDRSSDVKEENRNSNEGGLLSLNLNPETLKRPGCAQEGSKYLDLGLAMLEKVLKVDGLFSNKEANIHKANLSSISNISANYL